MEEIAINLKTSLQWSKANAWASTAASAGSQDRTKGWGHVPVSTDSGVGVQGDSCNIQGDGGSPCPPRAGSSARPHQPSARRSVTYQELVEAVLV